MDHRGVRAIDCGGSKDWRRVGRAQLLPCEAIDVLTVLRMYSLDSACAGMQEHVTGCTTRGKRADLALVDRDLRAIDPEEILDARVLMTIAGGWVVWEAH
ncbi:MAG: amidohydrolase family protein [Chloroflexota bacterium]|nr:amidohydrolase family protein [Chloroflexota bacterium]MDE2941491.1 amidohydrolase family protein [Chloroflexota bacterium]MDE3266869.1 amidohydrolase family protein [Chloroflexota bacterium]